MEIEEAITEFVNMLRIGTTALREIASKDVALGSELEGDVNQLFHLVDSIEVVGDSIRMKTRASRRGTSTS